MRWMRIVPEPVRVVDQAVLDAGRGCVHDHGSGHGGHGAGWSRGSVKVGDEVEIVGIRPRRTKTVCTGVEMFRKLLDQGQAGDNIGALLRGRRRRMWSGARCCAKPGSITPHTEFRRRRCMC